MVAKTFVLEGHVESFDTSRMVVLRSSRISSGQSGWSRAYHSYRRLSNSNGKPRGAASSAFRWDLLNRHPLEPAG